MKRYATKLHAVFLSACMVMPVLSNGAAISSNNTAIAAKTADILTDTLMQVSVVDYDTGELILTDTDQVWQITPQAGFSTEYVLRNH